jgi:hypothetical protein
MGFQLSPGINVTEIDLTTIVPSVATTIGGIAGFFEWGPANQVTLVDSPRTFRDIFGDSQSWNYKQWFSAINFLGYGRSLLVVRAVDTAAKNAVLDQSGLNPTRIDNPLAITGGMNGVFARFPGQKGNSLKFGVFGGTAGFDKWIGVGPSGFNNPTVFGQVPESSDNLQILNNGATTFDQIHALVIDEDGLFTGQKNAILERFANLSIFPQGRLDDGSSNYYKSVINRDSKYVVIGGEETPTNPLSDFTTQMGTTFGGISIVNEYEVNWPTNPLTGPSADGNFFLKSLVGGVGQTGAKNALIQDVPSSTPSGYNLFEDVESVNVSLLIGADLGEGAATDTGPGSDVTSVQNLRNLAVFRKDCVAFLSAPITDDSETEQQKRNICINFKNAVGSSSYVVIDSGYKYQYDAFNDRFRWVPLNADIAGLVARTDLTFDPWFSPAGLNRGQVRNAIKLSFNPNQTFRDEIYPKGINPVISVPGEGTILFGDRTALSKPSAFDRINVRRLFIVLEKAIAAAAKYSLFEFNDSFTRQQFRSLVEPFLRDVKARRGIFDWKLVCDETNNTPDVIDRNEFVADIYIKPTRVINFIQLNFIATRTGVSFEEVGA